MKSKAKNAEADLSDHSGSALSAEESKEASVKSKRIRQMKKAVRRQIFLAVGALLVAAVMIFAMTSAWYTNVSKTSSLSFSADVWGYSADNITISNESILIAPGTSGIIPVRVDNSGLSENVRLNITVSKDPMSGGLSELQKRIFFYADTSEIRNNETVSPLYIGEGGDNSYDYTVMPGHQLIMSDDYYNDVPLKWKWVYDMVGYYFSGKIVSGDNLSFLIDEYLRPIEYDLDSAVFDENGELVSVGEKTAAQLLSDVSDSDGYEGTIDANRAVTVLGRKYYPVSVNDLGEGVWAYLCTEPEINAGIAFDTGLSSQHDPINANMTVTAVNIPVVVESVGTLSELRNALRDTDTDVVVLQNDIELSEVLYLDDDVNGTVDLNGYEIRYSGVDSAYVMVQLDEGASLTVMNGALHGNGGGSATQGTGNTTSVAFDCVGGDLTVSNVTIDGIGSAVRAVDNLGVDGKDSTIRIYNCNIDTTETSLFILGNDEASETATKLIVEGSTVSSGYIGVSGNGNTPNRGTEYVLLDSTLSGYWTAVFQPQHNSSTLISGCTLNGYTGIVAKGGVVTVNNSTVTGTGAYHAAARAGSGWTDTGDGIYIEAVYGWNVSVTVKGNSNIISTNAHAAELFGAQGYGVGRLYIYGGSYNSADGKASVNSNGIGAAAVYGGTFNNAVSEHVVRYDN